MGLSGFVAQVSDLSLILRIHIKIQARRCAGEAASLSQLGNPRSQQPEVMTESDL